MSMLKFNRILQCDDVDFLRLIERIDDRRESGRLTHAGAARDQNDSVFLF